MAQSTTLTVTDQKVAKVKAEIELADALVVKVLEPGIDYGLHPGTQSQALKDPGAATIIHAFGCYPKAEILFRDVSDTRISYVIDVALISRDDGLAKSTGTGACTTMETKYGYRWVTDPEAYGYDRESLKTRTRDGRDYYRIVNPDWSELENTILKMARKRAEVDAAMALPGVSRFMSKLNTKGPPARGSGPPSEDWTGFWTRVKAMGLDEAQVHYLLDVASMKEWTGSGRTLSDAVRIISEELATQREEKQKEVGKNGNNNPSKDMS